MYNYIGGGQDASGADVSVDGGTVRAYGGTNAAGIGSGEETTFGPNIDGGILVVNGGYVFGDGSDKGCGIGAGDNADGAKVTIAGGIVEAWCGSGSRTAAFGSEEGDGHRGSIKFADEMMVKAGSSPDKVSLFTYDQRTPACWYRDFARIEPCTHKNATYTVTGSASTDSHIRVCKYCLDRTKEPHNFAGGTTCTICGVSGSTSTVSIYLPDKVDGTFIDGHYATNPLTVQVVTNTTFELPAPPADHLPGGVTFAGWQVGTPTELNINSYWVGNGELLYHPGANYAITGNVSLTARYAGIKLSLADDESAMTLGLNNGKQTESIR